MSIDRSIKVMIRMDAATKLRLRDCVKSMGVTQNQFLLDALHEYLTQHEEEGSELKPTETFTQLPCDECGGTPETGHQRLCKKEYEAYEQDKINREGLALEADR